MVRLRPDRICIAYFGNVPPPTYGVDTVDWRDPTACREMQWLALSVTYLQGSYIDHDPFQRLLREEPDRRAGYSIFLYRMGRPSVASRSSRPGHLGPRDDEHCTVLRIAAPRNRSWKRVLPDR